jgi:hypothetical protein
MARVRVFVTTYRRAHLLGRALDSLLAQTFRDWVCEIRNDAPDDDAAAAVVRARPDPRLTYIQHRSNLGGALLFNEVFSDQRQPFVALLEDDNWWHPDFLARMVATLDAHPDITVAWSNQHIWREESDGQWSDTGRLVRPAQSGPPVRIPWPQPAQCFGALHANGAMLLRTSAGKAYPTPPMELGGTEAVRERSFPHPLLYVPDPLAVFSLTLTTHRSTDLVNWSTNQVLLAATFLKHVRAGRAYWESLWARARRASPAMTGVLLLAIRQDPALRHHHAFARPADWRSFARQSLRRPIACWQLIRARRRAPDMWKFLDAQTAARCREMPAPVESISGPPW